MAGEVDDRRIMDSITQLRVLRNTAKNQTFNNELLKAESDSVHS